MWFDESVVESVVGAMPVWAAVALVFVSYFGSIYLLMPATVYVYLRGSCWRTATWPGIMLGAYALFVALKPLSDIPRPAERGVESPLASESLPIVFDHLHQRAVEFGTGSFPSGHAIAVTVICGLAIADLEIGTRRQRLAVGGAWVGVICFSRLALGTHYIGDVVGGILLGLAFLVTGLLLRRALNERPWRTLGPVEGTLALAALPALVAIPVGRPVDGVVLLVSMVGVLVAHRLMGLRNINFQQVLTS